MIDGRFRFIADDGRREARYNLAVDEALARTAGREPILRLWRNDRCIILGRFQLAAAEVDLEAADQLGVPVFRRFTGGGTVYHDAGNLNVSLVAPRDHPIVKRRLGAGLQGLYGAVLEPLAASVRALGIRATPASRGLFIGGHKVSGIAAWVGSRSVLVHATLLVHADLATLGRILAGPGEPGNDRWRLTKSERAPVTSIARELDRVTGPGTADARSDLPAIDDLVMDAFKAAAGSPSEHRDTWDDLQASELAVAADLFRSRYSRPAWHTSG